ncbi:MAG: nitrite/sulfite reductase, partial [Propionibacterium sp.]|nr:nitrite/sulfite reductase [Propionibacterium sp.]
TFVSEERAPEVWLGVVKIFRDYGYRRLRNKARLKFLLAEWGPEKFRQVLQDEYLGYQLPDGPAPAPAPSPGDHVGVHAQKDGRHYVGFAPTVGRVSGTILNRVAEAAERVGSQRVRFTPHQKLLVLDVPADEVAPLVDELKGLGLHADPSPFRRHTMACTGIEFCKLAFVDTKDTATATIAELENRLGDVKLELPITLNLNGCPNSCARIQTADIGLKGQILTGADGEHEFGYQVHLGGGLASADREDAGLGRTVRGLKVSADELPAYVERVVRRFADDHEPGETFSAWAKRSDEDALR